MTSVSEDVLVRLPEVLDSFSQRKLVDGNHEKKNVVSRISVLGALLTSRKKGKIEKERRSVTLFASRTREKKGSSCGNERIRVRGTREKRKRSRTASRVTRFLYEVPREILSRTAQKQKTSVSTQTVSARAM